MAKKKSKKRRPPPRRPAAGSPSGAREAAEAERPSSRRSERKEEARKERERRIRQAKRRQRTKRLVRWGIAAAVVAVIGGFVFIQVRQSAQETERLEQLASAAGCGEVQEPGSEGRDHLQAGDPDPTYATTPAASGPHDATTLPPTPAVYSQPVPERTAIHNLEHGYVVIWYRAEGPNALDDGTVAALEGVAEDEEEVIMAPHPGLEESTNLAMVAWTRLLECEVSGDTDGVEDVARGFIEQFRNATAPEAEAG